MAVLIDDVLVVVVSRTSDIEASSVSRSNVSSGSFEPSNKLSWGNLSGVDSGNVNVSVVTESTSDIKTVSSVLEGSEGLGS